MARLGYSRGDPRPNARRRTRTKEKKLTNRRAATADEKLVLAPPRPMSLEHALETIAPDEQVEVTPQSIRLRKAELDQTVRGRQTKRAGWPPDRVRG